MSLMLVLVIGLAALIVIGGVVLLVVMLAHGSTRPAAPMMAPPPPPQMAPPGNAAASDPQWAQLEQGARAIAATDGKIAAIKWVREQTGLGLAEAKNVVDRLA